MRVYLTVILSGGIVRALNLFKEDKTAIEVFGTFVVMAIYIVAVVFVWQI